MRTITIKNADGSTRTITIDDGNVNGRTINIGNGNYVGNVSGTYVQGQASGQASGQVYNEDYNEADERDGVFQTHAAEVKIGGRVIKGDLIDGVAYGDVYSWSGTASGKQAPGFASYEVERPQPGTPKYRALVAVSLYPDNPENVVKLTNYLMQVAPDLFGRFVNDEDEFWEQAEDFVNERGVILT